MMSSIESPRGSLRLISSLWLLGVAAFGLACAQDVRNSDQTVTCVVPDQPYNGAWRLNQSSCGDLSCYIPQTVALRQGSHLVYSCKTGYTLEGNSDLYCTPEGWLPFPKCIELNPWRPTSCVSPPQPTNGQWRLHESLCGDTAARGHVDCQVARGLWLEDGTRLVYTCDPGFTAWGATDVYCGSPAESKWSNIPICTKVCRALNTPSTVSKCFRHGRWVSCDSQVLPETRASVISCRSGYRPAATSTNADGKTVECNADGKWEPEPIECVPVCGKVTNETGARQFPWHASVYEHFLDSGGPDENNAFRCSATIIRPNLVMTSANCMYPEVSSKPTDPGKLFVLAGHTIEDWDHPLHDPKVVAKTKVKNVYTNCDFKRVRDQSSDLSADIALLEIEPPFKFSASLTPACLDDAGYNEQPLRLEGHGSIADVKTSLDFLYVNRPFDVGTLSVKNLPYVSYDECKSSRDIGFHSADLTSDKFCAGDSNRSTICVQSKGGGLMFEHNGLWHAMGIVTELGSTGVRPSGENVCDYYSLYTNVSLYTAWIKDVIFNLERYKSHPSCSGDGSVIPLNRKTTGDSNYCSAPPQPANGVWKYQQASCAADADCQTVQGTPVTPGNQLIYNCNSGYKVNGSAEVYCRSSGNWSAIPVCIEIKCEPLNSDSTVASCSGNLSERVSCDSPVPPGTWARVSCRTAYKMETAFGTTRREVVQCKENGKWLPNPIRCLPVCGLAVTHQKPLITNGTLANIGDFPWHATLYRQTVSQRLGTRKEFICGATVIQTNFLLTAAHCVYDDVTRTTVDPRILFVVTGNVFQDYDSPLHSDFVKKSAVKNVYRPCEYYGFRGNYVSDIALLELQDPFKLSSILLPACLDVNMERILEPGAFGRVAGFGRTATGETSGVLQTLELPYIPYSQCQKSTNSSDNDVFISNDKFCAGFGNGSAVCKGDSGGGLVFRKGDLWYIMGIVSVGLGVNIMNGERTCDTYSYSLYTRVSDHMPWIQEVMLQLAQNGFYKSCEVHV